MYVETNIVIDNEEQRDKTKLQINQSVAQGCPTTSVLHSDHAISEWQNTTQVQMTTFMFADNESI
jgi:hypothetical protein